jgi:hypothetical protein
MNAAIFPKLVVALWGDHWQQPCLRSLVEHGHDYTRQQVSNWKTGKTPVPEYVEVILEGEVKARKSVR